MAFEHDALVNYVFGTPANTAGLLEGHLGPGVASRIDFSRLKRLDTKFVAGKLAQRYGDLVMMAPIRESGPEHDDPDQPDSDHPDHMLIQFMIEHRSSSDHEILLRLLEYAVQAWRRWLREHRGEPLPAIVMVLAYQGAVYQGPTSLHQLLAGTGKLPELSPAVPNFELLVINLTELNEVTLAKWPLTPLARTGIRALNHGAQSKTVSANLDRWLPDLACLEREELGAVLSYLGSVGDADDFGGDLRIKIVEAIPEAESIMTTYAEQLGQQGLEEGRAERSREIIARLLESAATTITPSVELRIMNANGEQLDRWIDDLLSETPTTGLFD